MYNNACNWIVALFCVSSLSLSLGKMFLNRFLYLCILVRKHSIVKILDFYEDVGHQILLLFLSIGRRTWCCPILSVIVLVIKLRTSVTLSSVFGSHSHDYRPKNTPTSSIILTASPNTSVESYLPLISPIIS